MVNGNYRNWNEKKKKVLKKGEHLRALGRWQPARPVCRQGPRERRGVCIRPSRAGGELEWSGAAKPSLLPRFSFWPPGFEPWGWVMGKERVERRFRSDFMYIGKSWVLRRAGERRADRGRGRSGSRKGRIQNKLRTFEIWREEVNPYK